MRSALFWAATAIGTVIAVALLAAACGGGAPDPLDPSAVAFLTLEACSVTSEECREDLRATVVAQQPTHTPLDPRAREILFSDPAIRAMVGDGIEGVDYWLDIGSTGNPGHGDLPGEKAGVYMVFAQPVSWEGMVNTASQPCKGKGEEGYVDPDHPCRLVEREFSQEFRSYSDVQVITAAVYVRQGLVANMFGSNREPDKIQDLIEEISNR